MVGERCTFLWHTGHSEVPVRSVRLKRLNHFFVISQ